MWSGFSSQCFSSDRDGILGIVLFTLQDHCELSAMQPVMVATGCSEHVSVHFVCDVVLFSLLVVLLLDV